MRRLSQALTCGLLVVALSAAVQAEIIAQHVGKTDPLTEGFTNGGGSGITDTAVSPSVDAWNITGGAFRRFSYALTTEQVDTMTTDGWVASMTVRDVLTPDDALDYGIYFEVTTKTGATPAWRTYVLMLGSDASGNPVLYQKHGIYGANPSTPITLNGISGAGYHTYSIVYDPGGSTEYAQLFVDDLYQTNLVGSTSNTGSSRFLWGCSDAGAVADANWSSVKLSTIPEPGSLLLLTTGVVGLLAYTWRKRRPR